MRFSFVLCSVLVAACGGATGHVDAGALDAAAVDAGAPDSALCVQAPVGRVSLPMDDGRHADPVEWWYWTGHLRAADGRWFGFEEVFFRVVQYGVAGEMVHFAVTDVADDSFHHRELQVLGEPATVSGGYDFALGGLTAVGGDGHDTLHGAVDSYTLDLQLAAEKAPVLQHGDGYTDYSFGGYTYYYSRERMAATGTLIVGGETLPVTGTAWFDHQYGDLSSAIKNGWDWFAFQLDDGREIMLFVVRVNEVQQLVGGSYTDASCVTTEIASDAFEVTPLATWKSPHTAAPTRRGGRSRCTADPDGDARHPGPGALHDLADLLGRRRHGDGRRDRPRLRRADGLLPVSARACRGWALALLVLAACPHAPADLRPPAATPASAEQRVARYLDSVRGEPLRVLAFLRDMPKGGDLHLHLTGAVYAETFLDWAARAGLCLDTATLILSQPPCDEERGRPPAKQAVDDGDLGRRAIDAWSMRDWAYSGQSGHDHFFDSFKKFSAATDGRVGEMLADVVARAAAAHLEYLEIMLPSPDKTGPDPRPPWSDDFAKLRQAYLEGGLRESAAVWKGEIDEAEARMRSLLACGTAAADPGCGVTLRYIVQIARGNGRDRAFRVALKGFELAGLDPRVVAVNLVQPEDSTPALRDFALHMKMLGYLHGVYPQVHISLHAGELAPGLVPPEALRSHIRASVEQGHAERIGHGVNVMYEDRPAELLQELAAKGVLVEICLSSNDQILGVRGRNHPLRELLRAGVPVALATDDAGVARSEITFEYLRAVTEHGLGYVTLKAMARASVQHAFADAPTRARLLADLDTAFAAFEKTH